MKAFPAIKVLTGVMVLFFTCLSLGEANPTYKSYDECQKRYSPPDSMCEGDKFKKDYGVGVESRTKSAGDTVIIATSEADARRKCLEDVKQKYCSQFPLREELSDCKSAYKEYSDLAAKEKTACNSFDKEGGSSCKAKVESCDKKIKSLSNPYQTVKGEDPEDPNSGYGAITQMAQLYASMETAKNSNLNQNADQSASIAASGGLCVESIDRKALAQEKKDKDRERKDLLDKIKKQKDEILKFKEDLDEERDKNTTAINEIEAENKKDILAKEKSVTEETSKVSKQIVDIGKQLRVRNLAITKKMQELAQTNFTYQSSMLELSDSAVKSECQNAFNNLKAAIMAKGDIPGLSAEEKAKIAGLVAQSKGIRGSGNLKNFLVTTRQKCFDTANMKRNAMRLKNSQDVKNIQDAIDEEKNNMKEDKNAIATAQKDLENIKSQIDKEKQAAEVEKGSKLDALSKKLSNQIENTTNKTNVANQKIQELSAEINKLALVENFEVKSAFGEASEAIDKSKKAREQALETCDCSNSKSRICDQLNTDSAEYDGKKVNSRSKSAK